MASWMVHLEAVDKLLDRLEGIAQTEFVMGNIAPDSGLLNKDWTSYTPSRSLTHFYFSGENGKREIGINDYIRAYFGRKCAGIIQGGIFLLPGISGSSADGRGVGSPCL